MSTTTAILAFRTRYPAIVTAYTLEDEFIGMILDEAAAEVSSCVFGAHYKKCVLLLTAHIVVIESNANYNAVDPAGAGAAFAAAGGINSFSVGDTSASLNLRTDLSNDDGNLPATIYGQEFLRMRKKMGAGGGVAKTRPTTGCAPSDSPGILF